MTELFGTEVEYEVWGANALFTDPVTRVGGEKTSYQVPTYDALRGITESIYWKPSLNWVIDRVRVMNIIQTETKAILYPELYASSGGDRAYCTYLYDVRYQVQAHFEWAKHRPELTGDQRPQDVRKHAEIFKRALERGGRCDIWLGKRDGACGGYVKPCEFGEGEGVYDRVSQLNFGVMVHGIDYPTRQDSKMRARLWNCVMENGIITFPRPEACTMVRDIKDVAMTRTWDMGLDFRPVDVEYQEVMKD